MLSIIDLIERDFLPIELAARLTLAVFEGANILIGSQPSGAGIKALMGVFRPIITYRRNYYHRKSANGAPSHLRGINTSKMLYHP